MMLGTSHLSPQKADGCPKCGKKKARDKNALSYDEFLERAKIINGDRYIYPESNRDIYINFNTEIDIVCSRHGTFKQHAGRHSLGKQCRRCSREDAGSIGVYRENFFLERPTQKEMPGMLYYVEVNDGQWFKIGITREGANARLAHSKTISEGEIKSHRVIAKRYMSIYEALQLEQAILAAHDAVRVRRPWSTELFSTDIWESIKHHFPFESS